MEKPKTYKGYNIPPNLNLKDIISFLDNRVDCIFICDFDAILDCKGCIFYEKEKIREYYNIQLRQKKLERILNG